MKNSFLIFLFLLPTFLLGQNQMIQVLAAARKKPAPPDSVTLTITFSTPPTTASSEFAKIKYNKHGVFNLEVDDNQTECLEMESILLNYSFSDGAGLNHKYTAATAVNGYNFIGNEIGNHLGLGMQYADYSILINGGWDVMNHTNRHVDLINNNGINIIGYTEDLLVLNELYYNKIGYVMNCFVVPETFTGFVPYADDLGFLVSSSSGSNSYKPAVPPYVAVGQVSNIEHPDSALVQLKRGFLHYWAVDSQVNSVIHHFKSMVDASSELDNRFYRVGTHASQWDSAAFHGFVDTLNILSADRIWFTTAREWMEYRHTANDVVKQDTLFGNSMIISLSYDDIRNDFRWKDICLNISSDATIFNVSFTGSADSISYNPATGLINIYKQNLIFDSHLLKQ